MANPRYRVCVIGSGNWGSVIAKLIGENALIHPEFHSTVNMYVYEELINGRALSSIINNEHFNVKYLPGVALPPNVVAVPDLLKAAQDANILVWVVPHQFVARICEQLSNVVTSDVHCISLIKGLDPSHGSTLITDVIMRHLKLGTECAILTGANIAHEVAEEKFSECTIGCSDTSMHTVYKRLFDRPYFRAIVIKDTRGVELCGALKNIVAIGAGFVDGMNMGMNTKATIMRIGFQEMRVFMKRFYPTVEDSTFFESAGVGDLIATCFGGRNRKIAEAFIRTGKSMPELEKELLNGQMLQGTLVAKEVHEFLMDHDAVDDFPLFKVIYEISFEGKAATRIVTDI